MKNNLINNIKFFVKEKYIVILLAITIAAGIFLHLYNINLFQFADDQARDVQEINKLITEHKLIFQGPQFSVDTPHYERGHLGPFYFYLITPFYVLFHGDPIGNVLLIAILNIVSIYLIFLVGKIYFNEKVGLVSAIILTFSNYVLFFSRFPWNPNILIFFVLIFLICLSKIIDNKKEYYPILGLLLGIIAQVQASGLLLIPALLIIYIFKIIKLPNIKQIIQTIICFSIVFLPIAIYDLFHNFTNTKSYLYIAFGKTKIPEWYNPHELLPGLKPFIIYINNLLGITSYNINYIALIVLIIAVICSIFICIKGNKFTKTIAIYNLFIIFMLFRYAYKNPLESYFFLILTPFFIIIIANMLYYLSNLHKVSRILVISFLIVFIFINSMLFYYDIKEKIDRTYLAQHSSDTIWPDMKNAVKYMADLAYKITGTTQQSFEVNFQTCPATPFINRNAFYYAFNLINAQPSDVSGSKVFFYIIQPPQSLDCAIIDRNNFNIIEQQQFGKVIILVGTRK